MSDGLTKLKTIGAQKIHERTHIARQHVQALLHETFDDMTKVQLLGFISILEREYSVDLSELKTEVKEFFGDDTAGYEENIRVFVSPKKKKSYTFVYIIVVVLIFGAAVLYNLDLRPGAPLKVQTHIIDNSVIDNAKDSMANNSTIEDNNVTLLDNTDIDTLESNNSNITEDNSATISEVQEITEPIIEPKSDVGVNYLKIIPSSKLWIGYIDLSDYKKYQKLFTGELDMDPTKDWLMSLGHGYVKIEINGETTEYKDKKNIRLLYKDGKISKINYDQFKELNKGSKW
ncbi:MAG: hypothetical protein ACJAWW_001247 [Sulfurimonas sp.]|jgi:hypothetical protein